MKAPAPADAGSFARRSRLPALAVAAAALLLLLILDLGLLPGLLAFALLPVLVVIVAGGGFLLMTQVVGFRLIRIVLGPLRLDRNEGGRLQLRWTGDWWAAGILALPVHDWRLRLRLALYLLGSTLGFVFLGLLALLLYAVWHLPLARWLGLAAVCGIVISLLPFPERLPGSKLVLLLRGGPRARRYCAYQLACGALVLLRAANVTGQRPKTWNGTWITWANGSQDTGGVSISAALFGYFWALDSGVMRKAGAYLDKALLLRAADAAAADLRVRASVYCEAAYFTARYRRDAGAARSSMRRVSRELVEQADWLRAEAAVLSAERRPDDARRHAREALVATEQLPMRGSRTAKADWLREMLAEPTDLALSRLARST